MSVETRARSRADDAARNVAPIRIHLLGGFRVERAGQFIVDTEWQRPRAKSLIKLLAIRPDHRLHRDQIQDLLWPDLPPRAAANSFRKSLCLARHAIEPELGSGGSSSHLLLAEHVLSLTRDTWVDVDHFEVRAHEALLAEDLLSVDEALSYYAGDVLPEDRYEDWAAMRRDRLSDLHLRLLVRAAELHEALGEIDSAIDRLQQALGADRTREDVHRRLMQLYVSGGKRNEALRQYQLCCRILREHVDADPDQQTQALDRAIRRGPSCLTIGLDENRKPVPAPLPVPVRDAGAAPMYGRGRPLGLLLDDVLHRPTDLAGRRGIALIGGETGAGKTRLAVEVARCAHSHGATVLWGACYQRECQLPNGPFVEALEGYLATQPAAERERLSCAFPLLTVFLPSLATGGPSAHHQIELASLFTGIVGLLSELSHDHPLLLVLDDLHDANELTLQLLQYLARMSPGHRWFILATVCDEAVRPGSSLQRTLMVLRRASVARWIDLLALDVQECGRLVETVLEGGVAEPAVLRHIYARSTGIPLFVVELVRFMREHGELVQEDGRWSLQSDQGPGEPRPVPRRICDLLSERLDGVDSDFRRTLALAASAGAQFSYSLLAAAAPGAYDSSLSGNTLLDALDRALEMHILEERNGAYAFRHPLIREAQYTMLSRERRSRLHGALAHAIEALYPNDVGALAYHYGRNGDSRKARAYLERSRQHASCLHLNSSSALEGDLFIAAVE